MKIDPYTAAARICDDDGIVRQGAMHHGTNYPCTGHAHYASEHYRCTNPVHTKPFNPTPGPWHPATLAAASEHTCCYHVAAARAVLADRERELLDLKGPCSTKGCRLHYAHSGPCDIKPGVSA